jgi:probable HAF family extracellular repeat protein
VDLGGSVAGLTYFGINRNPDIVENRVSNTTDGYLLTTVGALTALPMLSGYTRGTTTGLNDSDQIPGYAWEPTLGDDRGTEAYVYSPNGGMTALGFLGTGKASYATGINDAGQVVGYSATSNYFDYHAFHYNGAGASLIDLGTGGFTNSEATGINSSGVVVGYLTSGGPKHAFVWDGTLTDLASELTSLGSESNQATAINDSGDIVGYFTTATHIVDTPFFYDGASQTAIALPTLGQRTGALAINDAGQVVGDSLPLSNQGHTDAVLWSQDSGGNWSITDLNQLLPANSG